MARTKKDLSKESKSVIDNFFKKIPDIKQDTLYQIILFDVTHIRDVPEKDIVSLYLQDFKNIIDGLSGDSDNDNILYDSLKTQVRKELVRRFAPSKVYDNTIDTYFNDVKREYILHPAGESDNMDFMPENKDVFIKNNLKLVVECAKRYRGLGLDFDDLIQIGNYGLMVAFNKFDASRANLRTAILEDIENLDYNNDDKIEYEDAVKIIKDNFSYSKLLNQTLGKIPKTGFDNKDAFKEWTYKNIKKPAFSSIAFAWIRAEIVLELNKYANTVRAPKQMNKRAPLTMIELDSPNPYTDDVYGDSVTAQATDENFVIEDDGFNIQEHNDELSDTVETLLDGVGETDVRILKKKYGIGYPFNMTLFEISESEGISVNKVKQSLSATIQKMQENADPEINPEIRKYIKNLLR